MLSNKLTFSLASLVIVLVAALVSVPAVAQVTTVNVPAGAANLDANGFGVVITSTNPGVGTGSNIETSALPNLELFLRTGGTILLVDTRAATADAPNLMPKSVVISEIMWAVNEQTAGDAADDEQWIELYNSDEAAIAGFIDGELKLYFIEGDPIPSSIVDLNARLSADDANAVTVTGTIIDVVSNIAIGVWRGSVPGQNGYTPADANDETPPRDYISMYRDIDYDKVADPLMVAADAAAPTAAELAAHQVAQLEGILDGRAAGSWKASTERYAAGRVGTPGARHFKPTADLAATAVAYDKIIINEIGNGAADKNDWIEIRNVSTSAVDLKNYSITQITGDPVVKDKTAETALVEFPDKSLNLAAGGILLIVNTDPSKTAIAAGKLLGDADGETPAQDQLPTGTDSLYYVSSDLKLANTGASILVVRSDKAKIGTHETIVDLTGTNYVEHSHKDFRTEIWPLKATSKGHANVIDGDVEATKETFVAPGVYMRNADDMGMVDSGTGEKDWKVAGATGIGYDRDIKGMVANGTPGFPNDALKTEFDDADGTEVYTGTIMISEVMVDQGSRNSPQWIELYNSSMTQGVNIDGWELAIRNADSDDLDGREKVSITIGDAPNIPPNQTILIVSSDKGNQSDHITENQVYNLFDAHRKMLEVTTKNDSVLSVEGFYISLTDKRGEMADEAGNLDSDGTVLWALPMDEEVRSSLIRADSDGTDETSWVLASMTNLDPETYYGHRDDIGSPADRQGSALPVSLSSFRPMRDKATGSVVIRWITQSELNNAGFNILRSETKKGEFKVVNLKGIIAGHGTTSEKHVYEWTDTSAKPNVVYFYQIEDVSLDGKRTTLRTTHLRGNVNAAGKATTTWADLKSQR